MTTSEKLDLSSKTLDEYKAKFTKYKEIITTSNFSQII